MTASMDSNERRQWMGVLARASREELEAGVEALGPLPGYSLPRPAEAGLAMIQARADGEGKRFHLAEMTVTRCVVQLDQGPAGYGYVAGRDPRRAELAALFDALLQHPDWRERLDRELIEPLRQAQRERREEIEAQARETRVDFFTMVRGDDA